MKVSDFRIGNKIGFYRSEISEILIGTIAEIMLQENSSEYEYTVPEFNPNIPLNVEAFKPIPLTEEWLLKFGFENKPMQGWQHRGFKEVIDNYGGQFGLLRWERYQPPLKYVHQLQNLYFALTGAELEIKK